MKKVVFSDEILFKRLLALGNLGVYITRADGHYWLNVGEVDEGENAAEILRREGIAVNNKIYGGFIEAIETMATALRMAGVKIDETEYDDEWDFPPLIADMSRIDRVKKGRGGIF